MPTLFDNSPRTNFFNTLVRLFEKAIEGDPTYIFFANKVIVTAVYLTTSTDEQKHFKADRDYYKQAIVLFDLGGVYLRSIDVNNLTVADYQFMLYLLNSEEGEYYRLFHPV